MHDANCTLLCSTFGASYEVEPCDHGCPGVQKYPTRNFIPTHPKSDSELKLTFWEFPFELIWTELLFIYFMFTSPSLPFRLGSLLPMATAHYGPFDEGPLTIEERISSKGRARQDEVMRIYVQQEGVTAQLFDAQGRLPRTQPSWVKLR